MGKENAEAGWRIFFPAFSVHQKGLPIERGDWEEAEDIEEKMREARGEKYSRRNLPTSVMPQ